MGFLSNFIFFSSCDRGVKCDLVLDKFISIIEYVNSRDTEAQIDVFSLTDLL